MSPPYPRRSVQEGYRPMTDQRAYRIAAGLAVVGGVVCLGLSVFGRQDAETALILVGTGAVLLAIAALERTLRGGRRTPLR